MWILTLRSPSTGPIDYILKPGNNTIGRRMDNVIVIDDESASRSHAIISFQDEQMVIQDLNSTNGTFLNRERITGPRILRTHDQVRIGEHVGIIYYREESADPALTPAPATTRPLTHDLLLEAMDQHSLLLLRVTNQLSKILDLRTSLEEIAKVMRRSTGADKGEVILANQFEHMSELGFPMTIAKEAIEQRSVVMIPDLVALSRTKPSKSALLLQIRSILCVPVIVDNEVAALIYAYKTNPAGRAFDQNDVQIAVAISNQAAMTIQRAKLIDQKINYDSLTGLYNRSVFLGLAEDELQRAVRFSHTATIIMLDIDDFKRVNDTCGHQVGDLILKSVATRCQRQVRDIDLVGRYGGDEFILMLIETGEAEGKIVAERIRKQIADTPFLSQCGPVPITVSLGVATLAQECPSLTSLINCADEELYRSKNAKKNPDPSK